MIIVLDQNRRLAVSKYRPFNSIPIENRTWPNNTITHSPIWCSVDLRDGNQALPIPMTIQQKVDFFKMLVKIGFKEIEVGYPASNDTEFSFVRKLIEENLIPNDVKIQVLSQARESLVIKTMKALQGAGEGVFHLYNATSPVQRKFTFNKSKAELMDLAKEGVKNVKKHLPLAGNTKIQLEYSPEDFSATEGDFAVEICSAVFEEWKPTTDNPLIINLPSTVEKATPNIFADQVEYFIQNFNKKNNDAIKTGLVIISLHNHNDRGTGVACAELGLLAGASRIEGTLFGNGERTGNLDIITVALNMFSQGIDIGLDFSSITDIATNYTKFTGMTIPLRQPYGGELVFTSFSGSHQDAIKKAMRAYSEKNDKDAPWEIPYLPIDPKDIGREYEEIIRINAQSGKAGAAWILEKEYGIVLPKGMQSDVGNAVKSRADFLQRELSSEDVYSVFKTGWLNTDSKLKILDVAETHLDSSSEKESVLCRASISYNGEVYAVGAKGNGPLAAFVEALKQTPVPSFSLSAFHEHAIGSGSDTDAMAYVELTFADGKKTWGSGKSSNIGRAGIKAIVSAINNY